jgi:hypothetical protein
VDSARRLKTIWPTSKGAVFGEVHPSLPLPA